jgi:predicted esterase YcpF (UPF0227 family)
MTHLIYLHGFASSAGGRKAQYLRPRLAERSDVTFHAVEFSPTPADFEYLTITGMINRLRQYILDRELTDVCLIGSSMNMSITSSLGLTQNTSYFILCFILTPCLG